MYLQGRTQMINADTIEEAIVKIRGLEFDGVEINMYSRSFAPRKEFFAADFAKNTAACLHKVGVKSFSVGAHMDYTASSESFETVEKAIEVTARLGAKVMIITGAFRRPEESFEKQWAEDIAAKRQLAKIAEQKGVILAVEFEPGFVIDRSELLLKALEEVSSPALKVNADIGHIFLQDPDPMKALDLLGPDIVHAHLENMPKGIHHHLPPYEGDMDLEAYGEKFRQIGFEGLASLDVYEADYEAIAKDSLSCLRRYF